VPCVVGADDHVLISNSASKAVVDELVTRHRRAHHTTPLLEGGRPTFRETCSEQSDSSPVEEGLRRIQPGCAGSEFAPARLGKKAADDSEDEAGFVGEMDSPDDA
jgi:hypothetical protein